MESRVRVLFLVLPLLTATLSGCGTLKGLFGREPEPGPPPAELPQGQVIEPEVERREIREPRIDTEDFEVGVFAGILSIEDFGSNLVYGARIAYHVTEGFFVEASAGQSEAGETSYEVLSGGAPLLSDDDRRFTYYNLSLGYNIFPGEVFIGEGRSYNTGLYLIGGLGSTRFAGDDRFTANLGAGYRFLFTDAVALHLDFRDHLYDIDLLGEEKVTHNLESHLGFTVFF
ncbi:MAG: outer membrane beta-barrel domain-containing protein [Woeseiaceae bacterium]